MVIIGGRQNNQQNNQRFVGAQPSNVQRFAKRMGNRNFNKFVGQAQGAPEQVSDIPFQVAPNMVDQNFQAADNFAAQASNSEQTSAFRDNQIQAQFEGGKTPDNEALTVTTIDTPMGQVDVGVIVPQQVVQAPPPADGCEFPVQQVTLERTIHISNTTPTIESVDTDQCGNVIQYREKMIRTMNATAWVAASPLSGDLSSFSVGPQGIQGQGIENQQGIFLANSQRPQAPQGATLTVTPGPRVGRSINYNNNARNMAASMLRFKSA